MCVGDEEPSGPRNLIQSLGFLDEEKNRGEDSEPWQGVVLLYGSLGGVGWSFNSSFQEDPDAELFGT